MLTFYFENYLGFIPKLKLHGGPTTTIIIFINSWTEYISGLKSINRMLYHSKISKQVGCMGSFLN